MKSVVFDIGGTNSRIALLEDGEILWRNQMATPGNMGPEAMLTCMVQLFQPCIDLQVPIGVAIAGLIEDGCVTAHNAAILSGWQRFPLQQKLSKRLQRPVTIQNDARAAAWGEFRRGAGRGLDEFLFLTVSTGVGAGLILQQRLHLAKNGFDAEFGEMLTEAGPTLEDRASGTALNRYAAQHGYGDAKALCDAADAGDVLAEQLYQSGITEIARKIADLAVMLGIQRVAVGGSVGLRPGYLNRLKSTLQNFPSMYQTELVAAELGHDAGLIGAADLITGSPL